MWYGESVRAGGLNEMEPNIYSLQQKPLDMTKHRHFSAMQKRHRRLLLDITKYDEDFDYGWLHEYIVRKLKNMLEFYESGYAHCDFKKCQKVKEELREAIRLSRLIDNQTYIDDEAKALAVFYRYVGEHIGGWWS